MISGSRKKQRYMLWKNTKATIFSLFVFAFLATTPSLAYAPAVTGKVTQNTGAPLTGIWVQWDSYELGDAGNTAGKGNHFRYSGTNDSGKFSFKGWDSEGTDNKETPILSVVGKREYEEKIDLDYNEANGKEARRSDSNLYDIFNCHNETNSFSLKLPESMSGAKVKARWRRDSNNTAWSDWEDNKITLPKEEFTNSHDYEVEFNIELPKKASIRDLDKNIETKQLQSINTKVPACLKVDLCSEGGTQCAQDVKPAAGVHRVVLAGVGEIQRKLTIGDESKPIWVVECIQRGSAENPNYMCTTGNSTLDNEVFKRDNFSELKAEFGYSSRIFYSDGVTQTTPRINEENRQDVYEWETKVTPGKKLVSVFMAMYEPENTAPPQSGDQPSQIQATLSNEEGCRLIVDPYGRVYDSYTFEPLSNAAVSLNKKRTDGSYSKVIQGDVIAPLTNPQNTGIDGRFSFLVPAGTYRLESTRDGYSPYQSKDIVQLTEPQRADIPMDPLDRQKALNDAKISRISIESVFQKILKKEKALRIEGIVSHPGAGIVIYSQKLAGGNYERGKALGTTTASIDGLFSITIPFSKLGKDEIIGELVAAKKIDSSINTSIKLEPLMNGFEGFAVNEAGATVANATVGLYIQNSDVPTYEVKADERGYFTIPSAAVPDISYRIKTNTGKQLTARNFLSLNTKLSTSNNVYAQAYTPNQNVLGEKAEMPAYDSTDSKKDNLGPRSITAIVLAIFIFSASALLGVYVLQQKKPRRRR